MSAQQADPSVDGGGNYGRRRGEKGEKERKNKNK